MRETEEKHADGHVLEYHYREEDTHLRRANRFMFWLFLPSVAALCFEILTLVHPEFDGPMNETLAGTIFAGVLIGVGCSGIGLVAFFSSEKSAMSCWFAAVYAAALLIFVYMGLSVGMG